MESTTTEERFLERLLNKARAPFSQKAQQELPPLSKNEFFAALARSLHFTTMIHADKIIFRDLIIRHTSKTNSLSLMDCQDTIQKALQYLSDKYDGNFTPVPQEGSAVMAESLHENIKGASESDINASVANFLNLKATNINYENARRVHHGEGLLKGMPSQHI